MKRYARHIKHDQKSANEIFGVQIGTFCKVVTEDTRAFGHLLDFVVNDRKFVGAVLSHPDTGDEYVVDINENTVFYDMTEEVPSIQVW